MNDLVSIIVPVYNAAPYLQRAIGSVLAQTHAHFELLLINDGSTDESDAICDEYTTRDSRIRVLHQANSGVSAARNAALSIARGEFFAFLDADDELAPQALETMLREMLHTDADLVIGSFDVMHAHESIPHALPALCVSAAEIITESSKKDAMFSATSTVWAKLFRRSLLAGLVFDARYANGEDWLFLLACLRRADKICVINTSVYLWHRYDAEDADHASLYILPDMFEFSITYYEQVFASFALRGNDRRAVLDRFFDILLGRLVRAAANADFFAPGVLRKKMRHIALHPLVTEAAHGFHNKREGGSKLLPFLLRHRWANLFYIVLMHRGRRLRKSQPPDAKIRSIYRSVK